MNRQAGFTTVEVLVVGALAVASMVVVATLSLPMVAREAATGAMYSIQTHLQLARVEAVSRNRVCRFVVDTNSRELRVLDSMGTTSTSDDAVLHESRLPTTVTFASPDASDPVSLESLGGGLYGASFSSDGTVTGGVGDMRLYGGNEFRRVSLFAGGGVALERWSGSVWAAGS